MKYLKKFENHSQYESYIATDYAKPNVSYCVTEGDVHYNPAAPPQPNNIITYEAPAKLGETTSDKSNGLHTNRFNTTIVSHTFENGVGTIEFEEDVTTILGFAFHQTSITKLIMPNSVTILEGHLTDYKWAGPFYGCSKLEEIVLSSNLIEIGYYCFYDCQSLTNITIPNSVTTIGNNAFAACRSLTSVTIPNSVTSIGGSVFFNCSGLTSVTIGDSVTSIGDLAFASGYSLTNVTIPDSVTSIGGSAFASCTGLTSVTIPNSVTSIGNSAFAACRSLTSVTIPNSVTSIGNYAFENCEGLTSATIGSGVTSIGTYAFTNCSALTSIISLATTAPTITNSTFRSVTQNGTLYVPQGSSGYDVWMGTSDYYLGKYNWSKVEQ